MAVFLALLAAVFWLSRAGRAAARFDRPITIVVTFPAGGGTDLLARRLGAALQTRLGQTVVVENRPGASGNIGARHVAEAAPDGSTLLMVNSSFAINPGVYQHLDFDPRRDFAAVINTGTIASVLVVPQASAYQSLADVARDLRERQGARLPFASCGNGTPQHLAGEMMARALDLRLQHVPYKGCGPAVTDVAAAQVPLGMVTASSAAQMIEAGRMRAIAVTSARRLARMPGVPTVAEQGAPGFEAQQWHGLLAPSATPEAVLEHLHEVLAEILDEPATRQALELQGYVPQRQSTRQFAQLIESDMDRYARLSRSLGLQVD
ncbi:tripartite tricarboxylate transporter substrate binding protein [Diaphorobacter ruginosibacter]|uniref:tripartite tricarboxylate transporter substrate binding protein n=1 Tax=Diaphorobacter ruginosibacter TaxID=1715720 RepID=UPI00334291EF